MVEVIKSSRGTVALERLITNEIISSLPTANHPKIAFDEIDKETEIQKIDKSQMKNEMTMTSQKVCKINKSDKIIFSLAHHHHHYHHQSM